MKFQAFFLWFLITLWIITLVIVILKGEKLYHLVILISLIYRLQILKHLIWLLDRFIFYLFFQIFFKSVFYLFSSFSLFTLIWYLSITPLHFIGFYLFIICVTTRMKVPESEDFAFLIYFLRSSTGVGKQQLWVKYTLCWFCQQLPRSTATPIPPALAAAVFLLQCAEVTTETLWPA